MKVTVAVEVSKESYEMAQGLVKFAAAVRVAMADGWQLGADMPAVVAAAFSELIPAVQGASEMPAEYAEDPAAFIQAFALAGADLFKVFRG